MSAGEGGGGAPAAAPNALLQALPEIRRDGDWARLPREFGRATLTQVTLGELLEIDDFDAHSLLNDLSNNGVKTVGALLTASTRIEEDPEGKYTAKGDLASVTVQGALDQIAALRDRVGK